MIKLTNTKELYLNIAMPSDLARKAEPYMFCFTNPLSINRPFSDEENEGKNLVCQNPNIYQVAVDENGRAEYATISRGKVKTTIYHKGEHCFRFVLSDKDLDQGVMLVDKEGNRKTIPFSDLMRGE